MLATEEMPLTADLPGKSRESDSNRKDASNNSRHTMGASRKSSGSRETLPQQGVSNRRDATIAETQVTAEIPGT